MPTAVANHHAAVATTSSSGSGPVEVGRPVSGEKFSGKSVTWSQDSADTPSAVSHARTPTWVSTAGWRTRRAIAVARPAADATTPRAGQSSPAAFPKAAAAVAT